jgi:hypothetical protein
MDKPNFKEVTERLQSYSQNLNENSQLANSKLTLAFAEMINVMAWQRRNGRIAWAHARMLLYMAS